MRELCVCMCVQAERLGVYMACGGVCLLFASCWEIEAYAWTISSFSREEVDKITFFGPTVALVHTSYHACAKY